MDMIRQTCYNKPLINAVKIEPPRKLYRTLSAELAFTESLATLAVLLVAAVISPNRSLRFRIRSASSSLEREEEITAPNRSARFFKTLMSAWQWI